MYVFTLRYQSHRPRYRNATVNVVNVDSLYAPTNSIPCSQRFIVYSRSGTQKESSMAPYRWPLVSEAIFSICVLSTPPAPERPALWYRIDEESIASQSSLAKTGREIYSRMQGQAVWRGNKLRASNLPLLSTPDPSLSSIHPQSPIQHTYWVRTWSPTHNSKRTPHLGSASGPRPSPTCWSVL